MAQTVLSTGSNVYGLTWWGPLFAPFLFLGAIILYFVDIDPDFETLKSGETKPEEEMQSTELIIEE
jgi:hypothetical protein